MNQIDILDAVAAATSSSKHASTSCISSSSSSSSSSSPSSSSSSSQSPSDTCTSRDHHDSIPVTTDTVENGGVSSSSSSASQSPAPSPVYLIAHLTYYSIKQNSDNSVGSNSTFIASTDATTIGNICCFGSNTTSASCSSTAAQSAASVTDDQNAILFPPTFNIPRQDHEFISREIEMNLLKASFTDGGGECVSICAGMGGVGKTQLAINYIRTATQYSLKAWFRAEKKSDLEQDYTLFAKTHKCPGPDDTVRKNVKSWMEMQTKRWLFVYDNVDCYEEIEPFLPTSSHGDILVTTRQREWPATFHTVPIGEMTKLESAQLVRKVSKCKDGDDEINELASMLGYLALALTQASAYIRKKCISVRDYITMYKKDESLLSKHQLPQGDKYPDSVFLTWNRSMEAVATAADNEALPLFSTSKLLAFCSYLAPERIPDSLLISWFKKTYPETELSKYRQLKNLLCGYSLITSDDDLDYTISLHRLVQTVIRHQHRNGTLLGCPAVSFDWYKSFINTADSTYRNDDTNIPAKDDKRKIDLYPHLRSMLERYDEMWSHEKENVALIELLNDLGDVSEYKMGAYELAKLYYERSLVIHEKHYGTNHLLTATTLQNLGVAFGSLGDYKKKQELLERALVIHEKHYGPNHPSTATTLYNLGNAFGSLGDYKKKQELLERALVIHEKHHGPNHPLTATTLHDLGDSFGSLGDYKKQQELLERALVIKEKHYGTNHPSTARALYSLGNAFGSLGDYKKQQELLERALVIDENNYGPNHPATAAALHGLGNAFGSLGDYKKRQELLERTFVIKEKNYGPTHPKTAAALHDLGCTFGDLGDYKKKLELLERALLIKKNHYGPNHPQTAITVQELGNAFGELGDNKKKLELLERALLINEKHYGPDHSLTAAALHDLGNAFGSVGDYKKAKELLERALLIKQNHYGPNHHSTATTLRDLGVAFGSLGDYKKQRELFERALKLFTDFYGAEHELTCRAARNLELANNRDCNRCILDEGEKKKD